MTRLEETMAAHATEALRRICSDDAPDYTEEARAAARAELARRGEDVSALRARAGEPSGVPAESQAKGDRLLTLAVAGWLLFGALGQMLEPLGVLSTVCFLAAVILGLRRISS